MTFFQEGSQSRQICKFDVSLTADLALPVIGVVFIVVLSVDILGNELKSVTVETAGKSLGQVQGKAENRGERTGRECIGGVQHLKG
jgi:hypothetical protein